MDSANYNYKCKVVVLKQRRGMKTMGRTSMLMFGATIMGMMLTMTASMVVLLIMFF